MNRVEESHAPSARVFETAREKGFDIILPRLINEKPDQLIADITGLSTELNDQNPDVRVQASAFLVTIARFRPDSSSTLASTTSTLLSHVQDSTAQVRENSVNALSVLKPELPTRLLPVFLSLLDGQDTIVQPGAIFGVARIANTNPDAERRFLQLLAPESTTSRKLQAIQAIPIAGVIDIAAIRRLGGLLFDHDARVRRAAVVVIGKSGKRAIENNRNQLTRFAEASQDNELAELANKLLDDTR